MANVRAMPTNDELIEERLRADPEFRAEWESTALARAVGVAVVRHRADNDLSQRELAERLGITPAEVGLLELGEINPTRETVAGLSSELGIELTADGGSRPTNSSMQRPSGPVTPLLPHEGRSRD